MCSHEAVLPDDLISWLLFEAVVTHLKVVWMWAFLSQYTQHSCVQQRQIKMKRTLPSALAPLLLKAEMCQYHNRWLLTVKLHGLETLFVHYPFLSSWAGGIEQILQSDWFLERAEFSHPDRHSGRNPSSRSKVNYFRERIGANRRSFAVFTLPCIDD